MARRGGGKSGGSRGGSRGRGRSSGGRSSGGSSSSGSRGGSRGGSKGGSKGSSSSGSRGGGRGPTRGPSSSGGSRGPRSGGIRARSGPKPGKIGGSNPLGGQKTGPFRPGNQFVSGGVKNPRGSGGPRSRHLNRDAVLGSPKVRQRPQKARVTATVRGGFSKPTAAQFQQIAQKPRPVKRRIPMNVAQQRLSDTYGVTTYNVDGTVATIPTVTLPDGAPYNPNVTYRFDGEGGYTIVPKGESA